MKIGLICRRCAGHVLVTATVIAAILGIAIAAFLNLSVGQLNSTFRTQAWNDCMAVVEAGIEEALAHLNYSLGTNLNANGWVWDGAATFSKTRNFGDSYVEVQLFTNAPFPYIISKGYVPAPVTAGNNALLAALGPTPGLSYISRTVKVTTWRQPAMPKGLVVKDFIDFKGNNATIDSYDSAVGDYFSQIPGDKGDVVCNADLENNTGNANIKGHVTIGPAADLRLGPNSSIGSAAWVSVPTQGAEQGWIRHDANIYIPDISPPWGIGTYSAPPAQSGYRYALMSGCYELPGDLNLSGTEKMVVTGNATLWVRGNLRMGGTVIMTNFGARLTMYVSGTILSAGVWNKSRDPADLVIYGLPSCTAGVISTGSKFPCAIYAPQADVNLLGNANFFGTITAKTLKMNGTTGLHYDENLSRLPDARGFVVTSWQEL